MAKKRNEGAGPEAHRYFRDETLEVYAEAVKDGSPGHVYMTLLEMDEAETSLSPKEQATPGVLEAAAAVKVCDVADDAARFSKSKVRMVEPIADLLESETPLPPLARKIIADWLRRRTKPDRTPISEITPENRRLAEALAKVTSLSATMDREDAIAEVARDFGVPAKSLRDDLGHGAFRRSARRFKRKAT